MGAAASMQQQQQSAATDFEELDSEMLMQVTKVLAQEYSSLQEQGLGGLELEQKFGEVLRHQQVRLSELVADHARKMRPSMIRKMSTMSTFDKPEAFSKACLANIEAVRNKGSMNYLVAVDGSDVAYLALQNVVNLMRKNDTICAVHAYRANDDERESTKRPVNFDRKNIAEKLEVVMITSGVPAKNFAVSMRPRDTEESVRDSISSMLAEYSLREQSRSSYRMHDTGIFDIPSLPSPDFVVLGHIGRKGLAKHHNELTSLGSSADLTLQSISKPCILMKKPVTANTGVLFCVAVSHSQASKIGFDIVLALLKPKDRLKVVFVIGESDTDESISQLRDSYEKEMTAIGPTDSVFVALQRGGKQVDAALVDWLHDCECDYLAITPRSVVEVTKSRLTVPILLNAPCNVILCKA